MFSRYLGALSRPARLDSNQAGSTESTRLAGPFPRVSRRPYRRSRASELRAHAVPRQGLRDFLLFAARRAERRETMVVFAAKLKPPTDFSYSADERRRAESSLVAHLR